MENGRCNLSKFEIKGANFWEGAFNACDFTDADFTEVFLENSKLDRAIFKRSILINIKMAIFPEINVGSNVNSVAFSDMTNLMWLIPINS